MLARYYQSIDSEKKHSLPGLKPGALCTWVGVGLALPAAGVARGRAQQAAPLQLPQGNFHNILIFFH